VRGGGDEPPAAMRERGQSKPSGRGVNNKERLINTASVTL